MIILRLSYDDNAKVTIDLRRILIYKTRLSLGTIHSQNRKIVCDSVRKFAYDIPDRNISTL